MFLSWSFFFSVYNSRAFFACCVPNKTETYNVFQTYEHIIYLILIRHRNINVVVSHQVRSFHNCFLEKHNKNASEENLRNCCSHNVSVLLITVWFLVQETNFFQFLSKSVFVSWATDVRRACYLLEANIILWRSHLTTWPCAKNHAQNVSLRSIEWLKTKRL